MSQSVQLSPDACSESLPLQGGGEGDQGEQEQLLATFCTAAIAMLGSVANPDQQLVRQSTTLLIGLLSTQDHLMLCES